MSEGRYICAVRSPLKGGVNVQIGRKTLLLGDNRSGKTAVLQALKLATIGRVDDHEGMDGVAKTKSISRLFAPEEPLEALAVDSEGGEFRWSTQPKGRGFKQPTVTHPGYEVSFPYQDLRSVLSGDWRKVQKWLDERMGTGFTDEALVNLLPSVRQEDARKALQEFDARSPLELGSVLKSTATSLRRKATRSEKTLEALVSGIPAPLAPEEVELLEARLAELTAQGTAPDSMDPTEHAHLRDRIVAKIELIDRKSTELEALGAPAPDEDPSILSAAVEALRLIQHHRANLNDDFCHVCLNVKADLPSAEQRWHDIRSTFHASASRIRLERELASVTEEVERLAEVFRSAVVVDISAVIEERQGIAARLASSAQSARVWRQHEAQRRAIQLDRALADTWATLGKLWVEEGERFLGAAKKAYEDSVTKWLPVGELFNADVDVGRVGVSNGLAPNLVYTSLSGTEWCRVLLAVLAAEAERDPGGSTLRILEPEDRGWDPVTLAETMKALSSASDQILLMSTVAPAEVPPEWVVVDLNQAAM